MSRFDQGLGESEQLAHSIARAKEGDASALHFLYVRYADDVRRYVHGIVRDRHEAEDITQSLFAKLLKKIRKYEPCEVPFSAWILRVARNATLDHMRAQRMIPVHDVRATDEGREDGRFDRNESLKEALERLPDEQREVVVLRHVAGLSPAEIAHRMKRTESSIHGLHHRGRRALRTTLRELDTTPAVRSRLVPGQLATCGARVRVEVAG